MFFRFLCINDKSSSTKKARTKDISADESMFLMKNLIQTKERRNSIKTRKILSTIFKTFIFILKVLTFAFFINKIYFLSTFGAYFIDFLGFSLYYINRGAYED